MLPARLVTALWTGLLAAAAIMATDPLVEARFLRLKRSLPAPEPVPRNA